MADFFPGYVVGCVVMAGTLAIATHGFDTHKTEVKKVSVPAAVVPCSPSQIAKAVVRGGTGSFTTPSGQTVQVKSPTGAWCEVQ